MAISECLETFHRRFLMWTLAVNQRNCQTPSMSSSSCCARFSGVTTPAGEVTDDDRPDWTVVDRARRGGPDHVAATCGTETITRAELESWANRLARAFGEFGVRQGDFVTITLPNSIALFAVAFALWKLGATPQPVSHQRPYRERAAIIALAKPTLIVGAADGEYGGIRTVPAGFVPDLAHSDAPIVPACVSPAWKAPTSGGRTGLPKPAPRAILAAAVEGAQVDFATASTIESRYFTGLVTGQVAKNMIKAFFDLRHVASGGSRPAGYPTHQAKRVVVLGAGLMGAGIAYACAAAGLDVILKDVTRTAAERGKAYSAKLLDNAVANGTVTKMTADEVLARITPTDTARDAAGADLVIEAVFENPGLKHKVLAEIEEVVAPDAVLASNTSTLPITGLAAGVRRPEDLVGLHFFSPVEKMELLEIIGGEKTSDATLAKAFDIARQIRKTPIPRCNCWTNWHCR
jgi:hypothetical protein